LLCAPGNRLVHNPGMLQRFIGAVVGALAFVFLFIFASFVLALVVAAGLLIGGWLWWRTRHLRRTARQQKGSIIEGEFRDETAPQRIERRTDHPANE